MTAAYWAICVAGVAGLILAIVAIALLISRKRGEERIAGEITAGALEGLEAFQKHMAEPVPTGDDLIDRLP